MSPSAALPVVFVMLGVILLLQPLALPSEVRAADVGGWMAHRERMDARMFQPAAIASCPQAVAKAVQEGSAQAAYEAGLCYLHAQPSDTVAAKAWLAKAATQSHLPAHRMLKSVERVEAVLAHPSTPHCHDLGEGRQLCHGGLVGLGPVDPSHQSRSTGQAASGAPTAPETGDP